MEVVIDRDAFIKGLQMVQNIVERSPFFVVATANGGNMTWTFEPSDARISTRPLLRSTSVISPLTT